MISLSCWSSTASSLLPHSTLLFFYLSTSHHSLFLSSSFLSQPLLRVTIHFTCSFSTRGVSTYAEFPERLSDEKNFTKVAWKAKYPISPELTPLTFIRSERNKKEEEGGEGCVFMVSMHHPNLYIFHSALEIHAAQARN